MILMVSAKVKFLNRSIVWCGMLVLVAGYLIREHLLVTTMLPLPTILAVVFMQ